MRNLLVVFTLFISLDLFGQSGLAEIINSNLELNHYGSMILYPGIEVEYLKKYEPKPYNKILYQTNAPDQIKEIFKKLLEKTGYVAFDYENVFNKESYTEEEINEKLEIYQIDCFIVILYNSEGYKSGSKTTMVPAGNVAVAKTKEISKTIVNLNIQFYDDSENENPFYLVNGTLEGDGIGKQIPLSEKLFWITLKELKKKEMLLPN